MQLAASIIVALVTAILTANLAISRFKRERVWERQAESYSRILYAIETAAKYSESYVSDYYDMNNHNQEFTDNRQDTALLLEDRKKAEAELKELQAKYHFFLSKSTRTTLEKFHRGVTWEDWEDGVDVAQRDLEHLKALKKEIETEAEIAVGASPSNTLTIFQLLFRWCDFKLSPLVKTLERQLRIKS
ncbi:hypothetical protein QO259_05710 [Salinicola sp. JS01]|uniref:hypothetical protein n=1 Tax=Salinicola sp. JS01 TaxID=3050071 RepID=UPI00255B5CC6|nr:hypothetical protein [Salinicola sp. JS01]WIX34159.1 hypothetical protein QO259_05710 [Salinicola sp. JS01]